MKLAVYNGSPRAMKSNTERILKHFLRHMDKKDYTLHYLYQEKNRESQAADLLSSDVIVFAFPLYVHAMPSGVKDFFESLPKDIPPGKKFGFIVHSGFPETRQSQWVEKYCEKLPSRFKGSYLGTIIKGETESFRVKPAFLIKGSMKLFEKAGRHLFQTGEFSPKLVKKIAGKEESISHKLYLKIMYSTGLVNTYWKLLMRKNNALKLRDARPYKKQEE